MSRVEYGTGPLPPAAPMFAITGLWFAASMMLLVGTFEILGGLAAIIHDDFFVVGRHYAFNLDTTAWGWIHLTLGIVMVVSGCALFAGRVWAAVIALVLAMLSAVANFLFIPYYPWWSLLIIALDAWIIWSLTRPGVVVRT